jgi:hypothetical protein
LEDGAPGVSGYWVPPPVLAGGTTL